MKEKLTLEQAHGMTWGQVINYYYPDMSPPEINIILWESTCFPFDTAKTLDQIYEYYLKTQDKNLNHRP